MLTLLTLLGVLAAAPVTASAASPATHGAIEATIRGTTAPLDAVLLVRLDNDDWQQRDHQVLPSTVRHVSFRNLTPGVYQLRLQGSNGTEQLGTKVVVGAGSIARPAIEVTPLVLTGNVVLGETALPDAALIISNREFRWRGGIVLSADGTFTVPFWQPGSYVAAVRSPALSTNYNRIVELSGASPVRMSLTLPEREVRGTVRSLKDGTPVAGASLDVEVKSSEGTQSFRVNSDGSGRFRLGAADPGSYSLIASAPRYLQSSPVTFKLAEGERLRELDVRVDPGRLLPLQVVDSAGVAIDEAIIMAATAGNVRSHTKTDVHGAATVAVPTGEAATVFILPQEGSFAIVRVASGTAIERQRIVVPTPSSSLDVLARTTAGKPIQQVALLMRYNGEIVPPAVAEESTLTDGITFTTDSTGHVVLRRIPPGVYEFWPYRTEEESAAIIATAESFAAPIQVNVRTGENKVAVNFKAR
jgi:hypothetical protein